MTVVTKRFRLYSIEELQNLPAAAWLIDGILERPAVGCLFGPSGEGKTFVMLDWSLSVAAGRVWQGRKVKQGPVVYVVAEGAANIPKRVKAWLQHNQVASVDDAFFVLEAVQLRTPARVTSLLQAIKETCQKPAFIVLDTFAQCFVGGEENSAKDVGEAVAAARRLSAETGATVILGHHSGRARRRVERGSSALRGNVDVMISVRKTPADKVTITNTKQKDHKLFADIELTLQRVSLGRDDDGHELSSCVLVELDAGARVSERGLCGRGPGDAGPRSRPPINKSQQQALSALSRDLSSGDWRKATGTRRGCEVSPRTFANWRKTLLDWGLVEAVPDKRRHYRATQAGRAMAEACHS